MPESLDELDLLLLTVSTSARCSVTGSTATGAVLLEHPPAYVGEPVTVRNDPRDLAEIRLYHQDEFLCRAVSPEIATVTVSMQDLQAPPNQRLRGLWQKLTARRSLVELLDSRPAPPVLPLEGRNHRAR